MSSIVGLQGKFIGNDIIRMLKVSKYRGRDSSGVYLGDVSLDINLDEFNDESQYNIAFGQNLSYVYDLCERESVFQPVFNENLTLVFDGELYNFKSVRNLLEKLGLKEDIKSGAEALLCLIDFYNNGDLLKAVESAICLIDGDYAFAVFDGDNLAIARDPLGVKPLFYSVSDELCAFASSRQSLREVGFSDINTLLPEHILFNWNDIAPPKHIYEKNFKADVSKIDKLLKLSVVKRIDELDHVGVIFSGGVDSSYLALLLSEIAENNPLKITLYAVGVEGSKDVDAAIYASKYLNLPLKIKYVTEDIIRRNIPQIVNVVDDDNLMKLGVGMTIYLACELVKEDGLKVAISGQGADELFGGYNRYLESYKKGKLNEELRHDIANMYHVNLERDDACSMLNEVELRLPFLDKNLVELVLNIPDNKKIVSSSDDLRKSILRKIAFEEGLDYNIAYRPKKAAQYGTGIDKILRKKIIKDTDLSSYLNQ